LVLERNIFAHGNIFIDTRDGSVLLEYYQGGIRKEKIDEERIQSILEKCKPIDRMLVELNDFLRNNRLEITEPDVKFTKTYATD